MGDVRNVRARPGGRVTLRFTDSGYRAFPRNSVLETWIGRFLGDGAAGISIIAVLVLGGIAAQRWGSREAVALLSVPRVRAWVKRWWTTKTPSGKSLVDRLIPIRRSSRCRCAETVLGDGLRVRYTGPPALEREFRAMLSAPRDAAGIGP